MKRNLKILSLTLIAIGASLSTKSQIKLKPETFEGKVKSISEHRVAVTKEGESPYGNLVVLFDPLGREKESYLILFGDTMTHHVYEYSITGYKKWINMKMPVQDELKFDEKNNLVEQKTFLQDGSADMIYRYQYDDQNQMIVKEEFNTDGQSGNTYKYTYKNGKIESEFRLVDSRVIDRIFYKYDDTGNLIEEEANFLEPYDDQKYYKQSMTYDKNGNLIQSTRKDEKGKIITEYFWEFDHHNQVVKYMAKDFKNKLNEKKTYSYEYDSTGNWIKMSVTEKGKPLMKHEREILYY